MGSDKSKKSENIVIRQWHIINFLILHDNYISSEDIRAYLAEKNIEMGIRTIQRDLEKLAQVMPIECRKDDKPYSWRWQRVQGAEAHQLSLTQALTFKLIQSELKDHIPTAIFEELTPIFLRAELLLSNANINNHAIDDVLKKGLRPMSEIARIKQKLKLLVDKADILKSPAAVADTHVSQDTLQKLATQLTEMELNDLAKEVEDFIN